MSLTKGTVYTLFLTIIKILSDIIHTNYHALSQIGKQCPGIYQAHFCLLGKSLFFRNHSIGAIDDFLEIVVLRFSTKSEKAQTTRV